MFRFHALPLKFKLHNEKQEFFCFFSPSFSLKMRTKTKQKFLIKLLFINFYTYGDIIFSLCWCAMLHSRVFIIININKLVPAMCRCEKLSLYVHTAQWTRHIYMAYRIVFNDCPFILYNILSNMSDSVDRLMLFLIIFFSAFSKIVILLPDSFSWLM